MKIIFTAKGTTWDDPIDPRFGRADYFFVYDEEADTVETVDNRSVSDIAHGAGPRTAQKVAEFQPDVLITGNGPGGNAATALNALNLKIVTGAGAITLREAYDAYKKGTLSDPSAQSGATDGRGHG